MTGRATQTPQMVILQVELSPEQAAALKWVTEKLTHSDCMQHTYGHRPKQERIDRAYEMLDALCEVGKALSNVRSWPWIETGKLR